MKLNMRNFVQNLVSLFDHVIQPHDWSLFYPICSSDVLRLKFLVYIDELILLFWLTDFFS